MGLSTSPTIQKIKFGRILNFDIRNGKSTDRQRKMDKHSIHESRKKTPHHFSQINTKSELKNTSKNQKKKSINE